MNKCKLEIVGLITAVFFSTGALAENMSKADYTAAKDKISAEYKVGKGKCEALSGNAADICIAEAKGREHVAKAELDATYKPSSKSRYEALVARAEADYGVARERCDDQAGNVKDICVKEAKAAESSAKADAKAQMKAADANRKASDKSADARSDARSTKADASKEAAADKNDAQYVVAKEKCDAFSGSAKDRCLDQAKLLYGK
jgi:hypothetical protein